MRKKESGPERPLTIVEGSALYWDLVGPCLDDQCEEEERRRALKDRTVDFRNGRLGVTGYPYIGVDSDSDAE